MTGKIANSCGDFAIWQKGFFNEFCNVKQKQMKTSVKSVILTMLTLAMSFTLSAQNRSEAKNNKKMKAIELNSSEFKSLIYDFEKNPKEWVFEGEQPAVIDFFATWCGPCKMMSPVMDTLAGEFEGKVNIYKIDVDKEQQLAGLFGVRSIPTFVLIPKSGKPQILTGGMGIEQMRRLINEVCLENK